MLICQWTNGSPMWLVKFKSTVIVHARSKVSKRLRLFLKLHISKNLICKAKLTTYLKRKDWVTLVSKSTPFVISWQKNVRSTIIGYILHSIMNSQFWIPCVCRRIKCGVEHLHHFSTNSIAISSFQFLTGLLNSNKAFFDIL